MPIVNSFYIINKFGGLIYNQEFANPNLTNNDHLRLASTFHGLHTISTQLSPVGNSGGIEIMQTDIFRLECYETPTEKTQKDTEQLLKTIYELYSDYVLKNPFYDLDQPIRCELFDQQITNLLNPRTDKR